MNRDYMANMLFNINDVVETIQGHSINDDIIEEYDQSQFDEKPKTLMDIPKDWEGSSITIGDCLLDLQTHINELHDYFSQELKEWLLQKLKETNLNYLFKNLGGYLNDCTEHKSRRTSKTRIW